MLLQVTERHVVQAFLLEDGELSCPYSAEFASQLLVEQAMMHLLSELFFLKPLGPKGGRLKRSHPKGGLLTTG